MHQFKKINWKAKQYTTTTNIQALLSGLETGRMQSVGFMQVIPLLRKNNAPTTPFASPNEAEITAANMGVITFENPTEYPLIIPTHASYIVNAAVQDQAMTHAAIIAPKSAQTFDTAVCVQELQTGLIQKGKYKLQILPFPLREAALVSRYAMDFSKLFDEICRLNEHFELRKIGRIRYFLNHFKPELDEFVAAFECVPNQVGAIVLLEGRIIGIEITPSPNYWRDIWIALIRECYGTQVLEYRRQMGYRPSRPVMKIPFNQHVKTLAEVKEELSLVRQLEKMAETELLQDAIAQDFTRYKEQTLAGITLDTIVNPQFIGQIAYEGADQICYASLVARKHWYEYEIIGSKPRVIYVEPPTKICLVCGHTPLEFPPYLEGTPSYEMCPCCAFTYGKDDLEITYAAHRRRWLQGGFIWHKQQFQPNIWNTDILFHQLKNIRFCHVELSGWIKMVQGKDFMVVDREEAKKIVKKLWK